MSDTQTQADLAAKHAELTNLAGLPSSHQDSTETSPRVFHRGDYARAARMIQRARAVKGNPYQARPADEQVRVNQLAVAISLEFMADSPEFDQVRFLGSTQLPQAPVYPDYPEDESEDEF